MGISTKKLGLIGIIIVVVIVLILFVKRSTDPLRTPLPDRSAPVSSFIPKLDKLKTNDRMYVIGYLLLQRGEITSVSTDNMAFTATTFGEALKAQKKILAERNVLAEWPLIHTLEDQATDPLRAAASARLIRRMRTTAGVLYKSYPGPSIVLVGGGVNDPRIAMVYQITNRGRVAIRHLTGYLKPRLASDDWSNAQVRSENACRVELRNIAPGGSAQVVCSQLSLNSFAETPDASLFVEWRPDEIEFADGSKMSIEANVMNNRLVWGHYNIGGEIR